MHLIRWFFQLFLKNLGMLNMKIAVDFYFLGQIAMTEPRGLSIRQLGQILFSILVANSAFLC